MKKLESSSDRGSAYFEQLQQGRQLLIDQILEHSQLKAEDLGNFECRFLPQVRGWETEELEKAKVGEIGLISEGMVHIPVLAVVPKNSGAARDGLANLRMQFEYWGGDGDTPRFSAGFVVGDVGQHLASTSSFDFIIPYMDYPDRCIGFRWEPLRDAHMYGRNPSTAFQIKLPTNWQALFDDNGLLRDESNLKRVASLLGRKVDLDPDNLGIDQMHEYQYWCGALSNRKEGQGSLWTIKGSFEISDTVSGSYVLDGDIPVKFEIQKGKSDAQECIMTIKDIQIYPPETTGHVRRLTHLVRPKENSSIGDLVITFAENNVWSAVIVRNGIVDPSIDAGEFIAIDTLAMILAKIR